MKTKKVYGVERIEDKTPEFAFCDEIFHGVTDIREEYGMLEKDNEHYLIWVYEVKEDSKDYYKIIKRERDNIYSYAEIWNM